MGHVEVGLNPIVHAAVAVTKVDLKLVEDPKIARLFASKPGDLGLLGKDPTLQFVDFLSPVRPGPIPTVEHVFDCIGRVRQNPYPCRMGFTEISKSAGGSETVTATDLGSLPVTSVIPNATANPGWAEADD